MKKKVRVWAALLALAIFMSQGFVTNAQPIVQDVIIDSDFSTDVDDVLAMSMAINMQNNNLIKIRGIALCSSSIRGVEALNALLNAHKVHDIPVATAGEKGIVLGSKYIFNMSNRPHSQNYVYGTTNFYRMMLASNPGKINIITLGQLTNIADLLNSGPDIHSPLTGRELVAEKVNCIYIVGGKHNGKLENNIFYGGENYGNNKYYNNTKVAEAARLVANEFPTRQVWLESDVIGSFKVGDFYMKEDKQCHDIVTQALKDFGTTTGSASFDPFAIWIATMEMNGVLSNYGISLQKGAMHINLNGTSYFIDGNAGIHERIMKHWNDNTYKEIINKCLQEEFVKRR